VPSGLPRKKFQGKINGNDKLSKLVWAPFWNSVQEEIISHFHVGLLAASFRGFLLSLYVAILTSKYSETQASLKFQSHTCYKQPERRL
jgi:hypothetical protein